MKITNLIEDTQGADGYAYEHGLSFYIETAHHRILLDTGASDAFLENARKKGIDPLAVDTVIISHGHYDHAGGLLAFAACNSRARIYLQKSAAGAFYNLKNRKEKYIGMDERIASLDRVMFLEGDAEIDGELTLFSGVHGKRLLPRGNAMLKKKCGDLFLQDDFGHEQYLVVSEGERRILLSGCAHNGILNILDAYRAHFGGEPTHVISGFHTVMPAYADEDVSLIRQTAEALLQMNTLFYTGHCTGEYPLQLFKSIMGEKLTVFHSGDDLICG